MLHQVRLGTSSRLCEVEQMNAWIGGTKSHDDMIKLWHMITEKVRLFRWDFGTWVYLLHTYT